MKVGNIQIRECGKEIKIGEIIVANALGEGAETSALAVKFNPAGEEVVIVSCAVIEHMASKSHCQSEKQDADYNFLWCVGKSFAV